MKLRRAVNIDPLPDGDSPRTTINEIRGSGVITDPNGFSEEVTCHTPAPTVPPSPHLSIYRSAYNLADFDRKFDALETNITCWAKFRKSLGQTCSAGSWRKRLKRVLPITDWLFNYKLRENLVADIVVGITVAVFQVPQSMGYCLIAHVPPVHGLYTAFFPALVYAILGTSRHSAVGAFAIVSGVMTGTLVVQVMNENGYEIDVQKTHTGTLIGTTEVPPTPLAIAHHGLENLETIDVAVAAALMIGFYMLLLGILRFGFISIYLSEQLISGFASAASIYVFTSQLRYLFGVKYPYRSGFCAIILAYVDIFSQFGEINPKAALISVICIAILVFFKTFVNAKIRDLGLQVPFPIELFVVIGGTAASHLLDLQHNGVNVVGEIKQGLPMPNWPRMDVFKQVWLRSIPLAAVGYTITLSVGKLFGAKHGYTVDANQELVALGTTNIVGACFGCIPSAASLPRSAIQEGGGGRTQLVSLVNCTALLIVILFVGSLLEKLPNCVLASIIAVALIGLLSQIKEFKRYWTVSKLDGSIWMISFLGVIILDVDIGLYVGLVYSLLVLIYKTSRPKTYLLGSINKTDVYVPIKNYGSAEQRDRIKIYQFCGPLHFSSIDFFKKDIVKKTGVSVGQILLERKRQDLIQEQIPDAPEVPDPSFPRAGVFPVLVQANPDPNVKNPSLCRVSFDAALPTHIIIDCSMFSYIDTSGISTLKKTVQQYESIGITTFLASCASHVIEMLKRDKFFVDVPPHHVYISMHDAVLYAIGEQRSAATNTDSASFMSSDITRLTTTEEGRQWLDTNEDDDAFTFPSSNNNVRSRPANNGTTAAFDRNKF